MFRGKFLALMVKAWENKELKMNGKDARILQKGNFMDLKKKLYKINWGVNIQSSKGNPEKILEYLSRYIFRVAISNNRIQKVENGVVHFWWKDYKNNSKKGVMKLPVNEFIRRFLLHILPPKFLKVRNYGIFASAGKKDNIALAIQRIEERRKEQDEEDLEDGNFPFERNHKKWEELMGLVQSLGEPNCPKCGDGTMRYSGPALE